MRIAASYVCLSAPVSVIRVSARKSCLAKPAWMSYGSGGICGMFEDRRSLVTCERYFARSSGLQHEPRMWLVSGYPRTVFASSLQKFECSDARYANFVALPAVAAAPAESFIAL